MLLSFFEHVRAHRVPASLRELVDLLALMRRDLFFCDQDAFYFHARMALVKDEKYYDRFDQAFASYFDGLAGWEAALEAPPALDELRRIVPLLPGVEPADVERLLDEYREALESNGTDEGQHGKPHDEDGDGDGGDGGEDGESGEDGDGGETGEQGDNGESGEEGENGESGKGDGGLEGEGVSDEGFAGEKTDLTDEPRRVARKVWVDREYRDYDPDVELGTRNLKMALRRLRKWARTAVDLELDLAETIRRTAKNGGLLDIVEVPERRNDIKVLLLLDVGGSMDQHVELCAQMFSAARSEFKHLESFYFHNMIYGGVWSDNARRGEDRLRLYDLFRTYGRDYKVIFVGDADMGPHEVTNEGGSVESYNAEPGTVWMQRMTDHFRHVIWLNPSPVTRWRDAPSIRLIQGLLEEHMYHLSSTGIEQATRYLMR